MSITRGAEVFHMKVGLDITYQPTSVKWDTEQVVITIKYYACSVAWTFNDPQDMDHLGAYVGNTGYTMVSAVGQSKDQLVKTITKTMVPGASVQTFNYRGTINGIYAGSEYHPTHVRTATVAALPPAPTSPPSAPAAPTINMVDYSGAEATIVPPDGGSSSIDLYEQQTSTSLAFSSTVDTAQFPGE